MKLLAILIGGIVLTCALMLVFGVRFKVASKRAGRWMDWNLVSERLLKGQGTIILNRTNAPGAVWWSDETLDSDEARIAILRDALLTNCPRSLADQDKLRQKFPVANIVELVGTIRRS